MADIDGSPDDDVLTGTAFRDVIRGLGGDDSLSGLGSNDKLYGGTGNDRLDGGIGGNLLFGEDGDDLLSDSGWRSEIDGGAGLDRLVLDRSTAEEDYRLVFDAGATATVGLVDGTTFRNVEWLDLKTGGGADRMTIMALRPGAHSWTGGGGDDTLTVDLSGQADALRLQIGGSFGSTINPGSLQIAGATLGLAQVENYEVLGGSGDDFVYLWGDGKGAPRLSGNAGDDTLQGGVGLYEGGDGNDKLLGGGEMDGGNGDDVLVGSGMLRGGAGNDRLRVEKLGQAYGGDGDDVIEVSWGGEALVDGGLGNDRFIHGFPFWETTNTIASATRNFVLADGTQVMNFESLELSTGSGNDRLSGGRWHDVFRAEEGDDVLSGRGGDDVLDGGGGKNRLAGGDGDDTISDAGAGSLIDGGAGHDSLMVKGKRLAGTVVFALDSRLDVVTRLRNGTRFSNIEAIGLFTGSADDRLTGGGGNDFFDAASGRNEVSGGAGDDTIVDAGVGSILRGGEGWDLLDLDRSALKQSVSLTWPLPGAPTVTLPDGTRFDGFEALRLTTGDGDDSVGFSGLRARGDVQEQSWNAGAGYDRAVVDFSDSVRTVRGEGARFSARYGSATVEVALANVEEVTVLAGSGNDRIEIWYNGRVDGGAGDDLLTGGGSGGDNVFRGGAGNDTLDGSKGNDVLDGGAGDDLLIGDRGHDVFVFAAGGGHDRVQGFVDGVHKLDVSAYGYRSLGDLVAGGGAIAALGSITLVTFNAAGDSVSLGLPVGQVTAADFLFAAS